MHFYTLPQTIAQLDAQHIAHIYDERTGVLVLSLPDHIEVTLTPRAGLYPCPATLLRGPTSASHRRDQATPPPQV